jgi:uncharacterized integral membrane protein
MKLIRRILLLALIIALAVLTFQNQTAFGTPVEFSFLHWSFSLVLGFWILFAFAAGVALFALVDAWRGMFLRLEIRRKDQEIDRLNREAAEAGRNPGAPQA